MVLCGRSDDVIEVSDEFRRIGFDVNRSIFLSPSAARLYENADHTHFRIYFWELWLHEMTINEDGILV